MSIPYIDAATLEANIAKFMPVLDYVIGLLPGSAAAEITAFLKAVTSPTIIGPVVDLINKLSGAVPPVAKV